MPKVSKEAINKRKRRKIDGSNDDHDSSDDNGQSESSDEYELDDDRQETSN